MTGALDTQGDGVKLIAVTGVRRGRDRVRPGVPLTVPADEADELIAMGSARLPTAGDDVDGGADDAPDRAEIIRTFVETAITDADWTAAGTPKVAAVEAGTGLRDIAADELASFKREG